jgi:hypothetical protein
MPHELLAALETYLASPNTTLGNGNDWGLVQRWLFVAAQKDGGNGDWTRSKSFIVFKTDTILSRTKTNTGKINCFYRYIILYQMNIILVQYCIFCVHINLLFYYCLLSPCIYRCEIYLISSIVISSFLSYLIFAMNIMLYLYMLR